MSTRLRLARHGSKKRPFYWLVVTNSQSPRDSGFKEKVGTYNPLLPKESSDRINLKEDRIKHWLSTGAQPSEAVEKLLLISKIDLPKKLQSQKDKRDAVRTEKVTKILEAKKAKEEAEKAEKEAEEKALSAEATAQKNETPTGDSENDASNS